MRKDQLSIFLVLAFVTAIYANGSILSISAAIAAEQNHQIQPLITTSELVVGQNRFAFGLFRNNQALESANVSVRFYSIEGNEARFAAEVKPRYQLVENIERGDRVHRHADGTRHVHASDTAVRGLYVSQVVFQRAGNWGVEILVHDKDDFSSAARTMVTVGDAPATPAVGSPAPRSRNLIAKDVKYLREIDTSARPDPRLHQIRIADAIKQRKPQLIVFATPQFCTSRMCGPVVDVVRGLLPTYGKRVAFIHQEIWQDFATKKAFPTVEEWRLNTEPWIFIVDGQGIIRAKFEGLVTGGELEAELQQVLKGPPG